MLLKSQYKSSYHRSIGSEFQYDLFNKERLAQTCSILNIIITQYILII